LEGADVLGQDRFVAEVAGDFGEAREEFVHAHRRLGESGPLIEITRQLDLHRGLLLPRLYAQQSSQGGRRRPVSPTGGSSMTVTIPESCPVSSPLSAARRFRPR